jgi:hypothetical protein
MRLCCLCIYLCICPCVFVIKTYLSVCSSNRPLIHHGGSGCGLICLKGLKEAANARDKSAFRIAESRSDPTDPSPRRRIGGADTQEPPGDGRTTETCSKFE